MAPLYVADTHALIWYLQGSPLLGFAARNAFDQATTGQAHVIIPAIVLAELVLLAEKRPETLDLRAVLQQLEKLPGFSTPPLTAETTLAIANLKAIPDIHDRLIVAEALTWHATLLTRNHVISLSGLVPVIW